MPAKVHFDAKPIPIRDYDWCAVRDDYDGEPGTPVGYGKTAEAAIADLRREIEDKMCGGPCLSCGKEEAPRLCHMAGCPLGADL